MWTYLKHVWDKQFCVNGNRNADAETGSCGFVSWCLGGYSVSQSLIQIQPIMCLYI